DVCASDLSAGSCSGGGGSGAGCGDWRAVDPVCGRAAAAARGLERDGSCGFASDAAAAVCGAGGGAAGCDCGCVCGRASELRGAGGAVKPAGASSARTGGGGGDGGWALR